MKININSTRYLNTKEDIKHKDIVTLLDGGKWEESASFKKDDGTPSSSFKITIRLANGEDRQATLNWTNVKLLVQAFGDESNTWIDKEVRAWKTKSEKAKAGFTYYFVPSDWTRDDIGEWIIPEGSQAVKENVEEVDTVDYPEEEGLKPEDIPF